MRHAESVHERLREDWRPLGRAWDAARETWDDSVARRFESEIWSQYEGTVPRALEELIEFTELVAAARRDLDVP